MPKTTKKAERQALALKRRKIHRRLRAKQLAKRSGAKRKSNTHPHRRASALNG